MSCYYSIPYYPTLSLILVLNPITPKIKALAIPLHMSSAGRRPGYFPFLPTAPFWSSTQIQVSKVHYCNTVPLQMQNALNTIKLQKISHQCIQLKKKKELSNLPDPRQYSVSQTRVGPFPPSSLPLRKSSNIYIFNPIKNVKKKYNWVHCAMWLNISKAHPFCAAVTCIAPKSSSSSRLRLRLPVKEMWKQE